MSILFKLTVESKLRSTVYLHRSLSQVRDFFEQTVVWGCFIAKPRLG